MTGAEDPHAPHLAVTARPWPGSAAVFASDSDENYALNAVLAARSVIGFTQTPLLRAPPGRWDDAGALQVRLSFGALHSATEAAVLNGANLMAIGDGSSGNWELFQFAQAQLIGPDTYWLTRRLRGQLGSDALMPDIWPEGSWVVLLDGTPQQIALAPTERRIAKHYRLGPARRSYEDPSYIHRVAAFDGNGLRPYAPVHLRSVRGAGGALTLRWIRRTRVDGDSWDLADVPLGEDNESYRVRVLSGTQVLREETVAAPVWTYSSAAQSTDGAAGVITLDVAQLSARFGAGLSAHKSVTI